MPIFLVLVVAVSAKGLMLITSKFTDDKLFNIVWFSPLENNSGKVSVDVSKIESFHHKSAISSLGSISMFPALFANLFFKLVVNRYFLNYW